MVILPWRGIDQSQGLYLQRTAEHIKTQIYIYASSGIRTHDPIRCSKTTWTLEPAYREGFWGNYCLWISLNAVKPNLIGKCLWFRGNGTSTCEGKVIHALFTERHAMKAYWEWRYCSTHSLTSALDGGEWLASRPGRFTSRERAPGTHWSSRTVVYIFIMNLWLVVWMI
jgi:hypothetical protein